MLIVLGGLLGGCTTNGIATEDAGANDPLEPFNRTMYRFTDKLDVMLIEPVVNKYLILPTPMRSGISNFLNNLGEPQVIVNQLLQGKASLAVQDTMRFVINSVLGLGGIIDLATGMGLAKHNEDFGQTLKVLGIDSGPYVFLPVLGPGTLLSFPTRIVDTLINPFQYICAEVLCTVSITTVKLVDLRANLDGVIKLQRQAIDPYLFTRTAYLQQQRFLLYDGDPPIDDDFEDEYFEDFDDDEDEY